MSKKYLIISVTIILLSIFGLGGWWYYSKVYSLTANWQTYRNDKYGFKLKHPNNWFEQEPGFDFKGVSLGLNQNTSEMGFIFYDDISRVSWSDGAKQPKTLEEYMKDPMFLSTKLIEFLGNKAFSATFVNPTISLSETIMVIEHNGGIYEIYYNNSPELVNIEKDIISTFEFIK